MRKQLRNLIPHKDRIYYDASDVINRGKSLSGRLDGTVLEVRCVNGDCQLVTVSGVHRWHFPQYEYEICTESQDIAYGHAPVRLSDRSTMVRGRAID